MFPTYKNLLLHCKFYDIIKKESGQALLSMTQSDEWEECTDTKNPIISIMKTRGNQSQTDTWKPLKCIRLKRKVKVLMTLTLPQCWYDCLMGCLLVNYSIGHLLLSCFSVSNFLDGSYLQFHGHWAHLHVDILAFSRISCISISIHPLRAKVLSSGILQYTV